MSRTLLGASSQDSDRDRCPALSFPGTLYRRRVGTVLIRYDIKPDATGGWTVFDITTDLPAEVEGYIQIGLPFEDANDLADLLNTLDVLKRQTAAH